MTTRLEQLGHRVSAALDHTLDDDRRRVAVLQRLKSEERVVRIAPPRRQSRSGLGWAAAAVAAATILTFWARGPESLSFQVADETFARRDAEPIVASGEEPVPIRFSDASWVRLSPGARGRISAIDHRGATLRLEDGEATLYVAHTARTEWSVRAGPYRVRVTGTRFRVAWHPKTESFELEVFEGEVVADGPALLQRTVQASERIQRGPGIAPAPAPAPAPALAPAPVPAPAPENAPENGNVTGKGNGNGNGNGKENETGNENVTENVTANATATVTENANANENVTESETSPAPAPPTAQKTSPPTWAQLFARDAYDEALRTLSRLEVDEAIWNAKPAELLRLGAAARRARDARAGSIYSAIRSRFPGSDEAASAAFILGRMEFHAESLAGAATWLEIYLRERPDGRFARGAAGRLVEVYRELGDVERLERAASRYLERYPDGPHADLAHEALQ